MFSARWLTCDTASWMMIWCFGGKEKYFRAKSCTTGSISMIVVSMPCAIRADGVVPIPRPLMALSGSVQRTIFGYGGMLTLQVLLLGHPELV